jgi:hypothetical protein
VASYYVYSGAAGSANGTNWANAYTTLAAACSGKAAGDVFYLAHDHSESTAFSFTIGVGGGTVANTCKFICVNRAGSVPPVPADRRTTAVIGQTSGGNINFAGSNHWDGVIFSTQGLFNIPAQFASGNWSRFDNCAFQIAHSGGGGAVNFSLAGSSFGNYAELNNTTVQFGANSSQKIGVGSVLRWRNTPSALLGSIPSVIFKPEAQAGASIECIGVDFSAAGSGKTIVGSDSTALANRFTFLDCKLNASVTKASAPLSMGSTEIDFIRSGSSGVNYTIYSHRFGGLLIEETTIVRSGGASDGTTPLSWKIVTTADCSYSMPFECPPIAIWNDTTGSSKTATVEGVWGGGAVPNDDEIWIDVEYLGSSSSPQGSFVNDGKADLLTAAAGQTSSSETWGGSTTKFKLGVTFTAQQKGWLYARVRIGKASSTFYIDPLITLT